MTNREIAKSLHISPAALSLILNNKHGVSDKTRSDVLSKLVSMGYGNLIKSGATTNEEKTICFVVYVKHGKILNQHPFFLLLMESIELHARENGYSVTLLTIQASSDLEESRRSLERIKPEGMIIFATEMLDEDIEPFISLSIPYVVLDNDFPTIDVNTVSINNELGTFQAIEYLISRGHNEIGYLESEDYIASFGERRDGYANAMQHFNKVLSRENTYKVQFSEEGSYQDILQIIKRKRKLPTAFVCDDDTIAIGAIRAFIQSGYSIPDDISIIGFNDRPDAALISPSLTTINVPKASFGTCAVNSLISLISKRKSGHSERSVKLRIGTQLIIRDTVRSI